MKHNFNTQQFASDEAFITHMKGVVSDIHVPEHVLATILKTHHSGSVSAPVQKNRNNMLWGMYLSRTWRVGAPAFLALALIVGGVVHEKTMTPSDIASTAGTHLSASDDVSDAALDNDLAIVDSQMAALGDDTDSIDSALMAN